MLLGNADLLAVTSWEPDTYDVPELEGAARWTGRAPIRIIDRTRWSLTGDRYHETTVWVPSRLQADDGSYLAFFEGDYLTVSQDGRSWRYRVLEFSDYGSRLVGAPSDVRLTVERLGA